MGGSPGAMIGGSTAKAAAGARVALAVYNTTDTTDTHRIVI
ncbi:hypothetical protein [Mycobacterium sp. 3519A]|nr:hypothetical protein [Mycobacterium sp. 3519A]